jgi:hypothetical protein
VRCAILFALRKKYELRINVIYFRVDHTNIIINKIPILNVDSWEKVSQILKKWVIFTVVLLLIVGSLANLQILNSTEKAIDKWVAHPMYISPFAGALTPQGFSPSQMKTAYNLPSSGGDGTTIAIIDAYDTPNILDYFNTFSNQFGLPDNTSGNFIVYKIPGTNAPPLKDIGWQLETCLDVEWAHAMAPNAKILLVEAVNPSNNALLSAVDYATSQPGVVAVSMSWGGEEISYQASYDYHFNKPGITFFASSGDYGSNVIWPAASANVVSVGGTTLNLNPDGTVFSEVAWRNSSGGISKYISAPAYQTGFGLPYSNRAVPDVSYNGNASTGVSVYNGTWWKMGGTSAGAPQWAAIHALGLSATNNNLYNRAKSAYSSYFRDIAAGSNYVNPATAGYDLVTGLGSPLTTIFDTEVTITPTSGPPNGPVTLKGVGFALISSVNISYRNPINESWVPLTSNLTITSDTFSYSFKAPELLQNNAAGDNQPQFDNIFFKVVDNNNRSYNAIMPYTEWRRGLAQISNVTAVGLLGNNTNLSTSLFVQTGDTVPILGSGFSPGNVSILWDNSTNLGTISADISGSFNAAFQVPNATAGPHVLTINDGVSSFCLYITRLPLVTTDYVNVWHTTDFAISLTPDYAVNETFYRINGGPVFNVTANGQPKITTEGNNSTLEYWSTWNVYGTVQPNDLPQVILSGIKLDKTAPTGVITTSQTSSTTSITLTLSASDTTSGIAQMRFSNGNSDWSTWEPFATSKMWNLPSGDGTKTVNVQFMNDAGLTSSTYNSTVNLETSTTTPSSTDSPSMKPPSTANPLSPTSTIDSTDLPTIQPSPQIPELNVGIVLILLTSATLALALINKRKIESQNLR